jgi:hypothetical protein
MRQRGGNLARNMARLADAADHDTAAALQAQPAGPGERPVQSGAQGLECRGFDLKGAPRGLQQRFIARGAMF